MPISGKSAQLTHIDTKFNHVSIPREATDPNTKIHYIVTEFGSGASKWSQVRSISFPPDSEVKKFCNNCFCDGMVESVSFPPLLKEIENRALASSSLISTEVPENSKYFILDAKGITYRKNPHTLIFIPRNKKYVSIRESVEYIGNDSCSQCIFRYILIPSSVKRIGSRAFYTCKNLRKVEFSPQTQLHTIGAYAFYKSKLNSIIIPASTKRICDFAFADTSSLKSIEFAEESELDEIELKAFFGTRASEIQFPASLKVIGSCAFEQCIRLTTISFPNDSKLQKLDKRAFFLCKNLKIINKPDDMETLFNELQFDL